MISKHFVIFVDSDFLNENGTVKEGADMFGSYLQCHPSNLSQVSDGIKMHFGLDLKVVYEKPGEENESI